MRRKSEDCMLWSKTKLALLLISYFLEPSLNTVLPKLALVWITNQVHTSGVWWNFTYSRSISSSCKNSLVSARNGKRGSHTHRGTLSRFFFPSTRCSFLFHLITSSGLFSPLMFLCGPLIPAHVLFHPKASSPEPNVWGPLDKIIGNPLFL